ncbi:MAG: mycofactocin system GMC family oxidoreductase MftG [Rhodococcus sp. (in: high G+C Gram-positive bacteria)]
MRALRDPDVRDPDVIVVGGGSCGSVVAARLSEDPDCTVTVVEAGPSFRSAAEFPPEVMDARVLPIGPGSEWVDSYAAELTSATVRTVSRGRIMGGSGAINGAYFIRARPADFDAWPSSWSFGDVLPYFRALECDVDFRGYVHGAAGPVPVSRTARASWSRLTESFVGAALAAGFEYDADKNDPGPSGGVGPVPRNTIDGRRVNAALAYLIPVMGRPNLEVLGRATALKVDIEGARASGVTITRDGVLSRLRANRVVLCAGAVRTPQLMMLSGLGPAKELRRHGISVVLDHSHVGRGFSDHPEVGVYYRPSVFDTSGVASSPIEAVLHVDDLEIRPYAASFDRFIAGLPAGDPMVGVGLMRPDSRGDITLASGDPFDSPRVRYRYLESISDKAALAQGVELVRELLNGSAASVDVRPEEALGTSLHLSGSCAMGEGDSVLDERCRVRGIDGLHIVDTSAFPLVPSRGPHATAIMLAERASGFVRENPV